jgi:hypothetical protein
LTTRPNQRAPARTFLGNPNNLSVTRFRLHGYCLCVRAAPALERAQVLVGLGHFGLRHKHRYPTIRASSLTDRRPCRVMLVRHDELQTVAPTPSTLGVGFRSVQSLSRMSYSLFVADGERSPREGISAYAALNRPKADIEASLGPYPGVDILIVYAAIRGRI